MTLQNYSCMPALVPQLPEYRDTFPIIQDTPPLLLSSTALKIRLSTILAEGMGAVYYNTFLQEEAAAAAQMLRCPMFCLTLPALTNPGSEEWTDRHKEDSAMISVVLDDYIFLSY